MPFLCSPLPVWLGGSCVTPSAEWDIVSPALLLSPTRSRGMQELLSSKWSTRMTLPSSFYCSTSDFSCPLWLGCCTPTPKSSQKSTWPGERAVWLCQSSSLWQNKVLLRQWGWLPSFLWLEIDTLAASACTCQYEQTQELFFASHMIEWMALMELKFCSDHNDTCSQKRIQCSSLVLSCVRLWNAHISSSFKSL